MNPSPHKRRHDRLLAAGLCRTCGKPRQDENRTRCQSCREKDATVNLARYHQKKIKP